MIDPVAIESTERAVLFAALRKPPILARLLAEATADWFLAIDHRRLFSALERLARSNRAVDFQAIVVAAREAERATFGDVVLTVDWLRAGAAESQGITQETLEQNHFPLLREAHRIRRMAQYFVDGSERADRLSSTELIAWAAGQLNAIDQTTGQDSVCVDPVAISEVLRAAVVCDTQPSAMGPLTGIPSLDALGFRLDAHEPLTIAGRPGECKTLLMTQMSLGVTMDRPAVVFALEDGLLGWKKRRVAMLTGETLERVRDNGAPPVAYEHLSEYLDKASDRPLYIVSGSHSSYNIVSRIREIKSREPRLAVAFIDQTYDITDYAKSERGEILTYAVARCVQTIIAACRELEVVPVFLQHIKRDVMGRPSINDIADSDVFAKRSRKVIIVSKKLDDRGEMTSICIDVAKWTHGKCKVIDVPFNGARQCLDNFVDYYGFPKFQEAA